MLLIDHVVYAVRDLDLAARRWEEAYGLSSVPGGRHPEWGTANRIVPLGDAYLELLSVVDADSSSAFARALSSTVAEGDRWFSICVADDDIEATAGRLGLTVAPGRRTRPDGSEVRWRGAGIDDPVRPPWLPFFIAWDVPPALHPGRVESPSDQSGAIGIERVEVGGDAAALHRWLGGHELPIEVVSDVPGVRAVYLATASGEPILID